MPLILILLIINVLSSIIIPFFYLLEMLCLKNS